MIHIDDIRRGDQTMAHVQRCTMVVRDIRAADLRFGVLGFDSVRTVSATPTVPNRSCFEQQDLSNDRFRVVTSQLEIPQEGRQLVEPTVPGLEQLHGVGEVIADRLRAHGFDSISTVAAGALSQQPRPQGSGLVSELPLCR